MRREYNKAKKGTVEGKRKRRMRREEGEKGKEERDTLEEKRKSE